MNKAVDDGAEGEGKLSRVRGEGIWSESGIYGQATLASTSKGKLVAYAMVECAVIRHDEQLARWLSPHDDPCYLHDAWVWPSWLLPIERFE